MESDQPLGKSIVHTTRVGNQIAVSLLDLDAAAVRCERSYPDPERRWNAFRAMITELRDQAGRIDIPRIPPRD